MKFFIISFTLCIIISHINAAKILTLFPSPSYSHVIIGETLSKELANRGHQVTMVTPFKLKTIVENLKVVHLTGLKEFFDDMKDFNVFDMMDGNNFILAFITYNFGYSFTKYLFEHKEVQELLQSEEKFDLIIMEQFYNEAIYGFCDYYKVPCIAFSTVGAMTWTNRLTRNVGLASYVPEMLTNFSPKMTFFQRLHNLVFLTYQELIYHFLAVPKLNTLLHQHFPKAPHLYDLVSNVSMVFLNSHPALTAPVPLTPNTKEIGGIHVEGLKDVKLPEDIQSFLDKHNEGVIYFTFGSNVQSKDMPKDILQEILKGLKKFKKPILWKYEEDLPEKIDNVKIAKWFPQTAVLAHKNVVAFITHCGRLSSLESLYFGVPMIGIPLFAEQARNAAEMVYYGYAISLNFKSIKSEDFYKALVDITTNLKYTKEAKMRSKAMRKRNPMDEAIYWVDHVLEFNGAGYLKNAGVDLPWYEFWMADVIAFLIISILGINSLLAYVLLKCLSRNIKLNNKSKSNVSKRKKRN